jgi:hypothetical protein
MGILLNDLADEVTINLAGYTLQQDRSTHLTSPINTTTSTIASPTIISLADTENVGKGIIEIDDELIWVDNIDRVAGTATVSPYGRGFMGSTAATHAAGARVVVSPTFPRNVVKRAIQDTIRAIGATIFAVKQTNITYNSVANTYLLDNKNIQNILTMHYKEIGSTQEWIRIRKWDFDSFPDVTTWGANSQTVTILEPNIPAGRSVKIVYATAPTTLSTSSTDSFNTQTGLPESCRDVVILGASYRLISYLDPARTGATSPQADETDQRRQFGSASNAARQLFALYNQRLTEETQAQQQQYPPRVHYSR